MDMFGAPQGIFGVLNMGPADPSQPADTGAGQIGGPAGPTSWFLTGFGCHCSRGGMRSALWRCDEDIWLDRYVPVENEFRLLATRHDR